jgi:signal transduction histidine kinase
MTLEAFASAIAMISSGVLAWFGFFLGSISAPLPFTGKKDVRSILRWIDEKFFTQSRLLALTVIGVAAGFFREYLLQNPASTDFDVQPNTAADLLVLLILWTPATWAIFTTKLRSSIQSDFWRRRELTALVLIAGALLTGLTALYLAGILGDIRRALTGVYALWAASLLLWATYNLRTSRRDVSLGDDVFGMNMLTGASLLSLGAVVLLIVRYFFPIASWSLLLYFLLDGAAYCVVVTLAKYGGGITPFTDPAVRAELLLSARRVLPLSVLYTALIGLVLTQVELGYVLLILIFVSGTITHSWLDNDWRQKVSTEETDLSDFHSRLAEMTQIVNERYTARLTERDRVGSMLHADVVNPLRGIENDLVKHSTTLAKNNTTFSRIADDLREIADHINKLCDHTRRVVYSAYIRELSDGNLYRAIDQQISLHREAIWGNLDIKMSGMSSIINERFPQNVTHEMYYLVKEALNNAGKYAGIAQVDIDASLTDNRLRVTITCVEPFEGSQLSAAAQTLGYKLRREARARNWFREGRGGIEEAKKAFREQNGDADGDQEIRAGQRITVVWGLLPIPAQAEMPGFA